MNEAQVWNTLKKGMRGKWVHHRIETSTEVGVPDLAYTMVGVHGWIELKYIKAWPVRKDTLVKLPLRPEQRVWIKVNGRLAGRVWVICKVDNTLFLLNWHQAIHAVDGWTKEQWYENAVATWIKRTDYDHLAALLKRMN